jgi:hypothetical protein
MTERRERPGHLVDKKEHRFLLRQGKNRTGQDESCRTGGGYRLMKRREIPKSMTC